ncbi:hypothetical protein HYC85_020140 [Camellia sinensis]|uniref:Uncharacterized protein n=1 Tax=Camellia sinensis TaxID=4442 RepID=A0A7J7GSU9_CAMSI|nr:hypothetical protein HYC85_020140 [Camellia sinensis]
MKTTPDRPTFIILHARNRKSKSHTSTRRHGTSFILTSCRTGKDTDWRPNSGVAAQHTTFGAPAKCIVVFFSGITPTTHNQKDSSPYTKSHKQSTRNTRNLI